MGTGSLFRVGELGFQAVGAAAVVAEADLARGHGRTEMRAART
jgi:hypothetical protein